MTFVSRVLLLRLLPYFRGKERFEGSVTVLSGKRGDFCFDDEHFNFLLGLIVPTTVFIIFFFPKIRDFPLQIKP